MPEREFDITIDSDGHVHLHIHGYKGKGCMDAVKMFESIVGKLKSSQATSEAYEPDEVVRYNIEQKH